MSNHYSIKCKNCAGPISLLGGGRVETVTCSYCKSVLDLNDNYKVLSNFKDYKEKHALPFDIGMKGVLNSIEYTIIGRVTYQDSEDYLTEWTEFLLFSPLYGYAWLTYEDGHLLYSRRERKFPNLSWDGLLDTSIVKMEEKEYKLYDIYDASIVYVEGELTWVAKKGDKTSFIDLIDESFSISAEKSKNEVETYKTEYLDAKKVYESFSVSEEKQKFSKEFHPLKPFEKPFLKALSKISLWIFFIAIFVFTAVSSGGKGTITNEFNVTNLTPQQSEQFTITSTKFLNTIELNCSEPKALRNFNFKIYHNNLLIFSLNGTQAYRFKSNSNQIETIFPKIEKDALRVTIYIKLEQLGLYEVQATPINPNYTSNVNVIIKKEQSRGNYMSYFMILLLLSFSIYHFFKWKYKRKLNNGRVDFSEKYLPTVGERIKTETFKRKKMTVSLYDLQTYGPFKDLLEAKKRTSQLYNFNKYSLFYILMFIFFILISVILISS